MPTQMVMFAPETQWRPPSPSDWPRFADADLISIDLECKDEDLQELGPGCWREDSYVCGIGVAVQGGPSVYLPVRHHAGGNVENPEAAWAWYRDNCAAYEGVCTGMNLYYDLCWNAVNGVHLPKVKRIEDVQIMETLTYELHKSSTLESICGRWGVEGKDKSELIAFAKVFGLKKPLAEMWKLPGYAVGRYNERDNQAPLELYPKLDKKLRDMGIVQIRDIEAQITPIIVAMRCRGIKINQQKLQDIENWSILEERRIIKELYSLTGVQLAFESFNTAAQVGPVLEAAGINVPRGAKGAYIIREQFLDLMSPKKDKQGNLITSLQAEVAARVLRGRQMCNLRAKFSRPTMAHLTSDSKLHPVYKQVRGTTGNSQLTENDDDEDDEETAKKEKKQGTRTGRFSCVNTNFTQQPSRQDWAARWKAIVEPEDGYEFIWTADYSQQEPRLTTHYAAKLNLTGARDTARAYREDPLLDNHDRMSQATGVVRERAKPIYLGLVYSMGEAKLCRTLGLPTRYVVSWGPYKDRQEQYFDEEWQAMAFREKLHEEKVFMGPCAGEEGKAILAQFHAGAPFLRELVQAARRSGAKYGEIITLLGRHLHLPMVNGNYDWVHKCLNMLIQGSAADQIKKAMVDAKHKMPSLYLQAVIHDSMMGSTNSRQELLDVVNVMMDTFISEYLTFRVDKTIGPNWGQETHLCYHRTCTNDAFSKKKKYCALHAPSS